MTAEEFAQWTVMMEMDWIGPHRLARILSHVAAGVRNGPVQGPDGKGSLWQIGDFIDPDRWTPPKVVTLKAMRASIRAFFKKRR